MPDVIANTDAFSLEVQDGIATLRFRKAFLNVALNLRTRDRFLELLDQLEGDPKVLGMVQINDEHFSGEDEISALLKQLARGGRGDLSTLQRFARSFFQIVRRNLEFTKPVVTGVTGEITMEELGVALTCDRVLLSDDTRIRNVGLTAGLPAGPIMTFLLPHIVGTKLSMTLLTDLDALGASQALELGLADQVVPREALEADCRSAVQTLSQLPANVVSATRTLVFSQYDRFEDHVERSIRTAVQLLQSRGW